MHGQGTDAGSPLDAGPSGRARLAAAAPDYSGPALERLNSITIELTNIFGDAGFAPIEPAILQPADLLFDLYGEEIWERAFVMEDAAHGALCLRPDFTVPVARAHLAARDEGGASAARYGYFGPVFRRAGDDVPGPLQHLQAGVEIIGEDAPAERDAEVFELTVKALRWCGCETFDVVTGDLGVVFALIDALATPESRRRRLRRALRRPERFRELLRRYAGIPQPDAPAAPPDRAALLRGVGRLDEAAALAAVREMMTLSEAPQIGVRGAAEIAERCVRQAVEATADPLSREAVALLETALAIAGPAPEALARLADAARAGGVNVQKPLDALSARLDALAARGVAVETLHFDADFGRNLDYYDGFVFEMRAGATGAAADQDAPLKLGGGGRYDRLFNAMGAAAPLNGIGAAIRPEAVLAAAADPSLASGSRGGPALSATAAPRGDVSSEEAAR